MDEALCLAESFPIRRRRVKQLSELRFVPTSTLYVGLSRLFLIAGPVQFPAGIDTQPRSKVLGRVLHLSRNVEKIIAFTATGEFYILSSMERLQFQICYTVTTRISDYTNCPSFSLFRGKVVKRFVTIF